MNISSQQIIQFQDKILSWYANHKRDLPWRLTRDPYRILVSEVMLQQTQVQRVISKYIAWFEAFPTIQHLAKAKTSEVLRLWSGLGYNRRALYLQKTAQSVVSEHEGVWPQTIEGLKKLPGIGEYTARAVACFAFDQQVAVVDTNVRRVILTQFPMSNVKYQISNERQLQEIAETLLPKGNAYDWNQALMDYASVMLKKERIPIPKQSTFKGSNRYYRGKLLKTLLERQIITTGEVGKVLKDDFSGKDTQWLSDLLSGMERDGFIKKEKSHITLTE
jgi:A/G-specific adenine glycosylase